MSKSVLVVGYSNKQNIYVQNWARSMSQSGFDYKLIGIGQKWLGVITRIEAYLSFLLNELKSDLIYIFLDVHDVLAVGSPKEFYDQWLKFSTPIVIGAEPNCLPSVCRPLTTYWQQHDKINSNLYLNFGLVAGDRDSLIKFLTQLQLEANQGNPLKWNEQIAASKYLDQYPEEVSLDMEMKLIGNIICHPLNGNLKKFSWSAQLNKVIYQHDSARNIQKPIFLHIPAKNCDAFQRYHTYGSLILKDQWQISYMDMIVCPGAYWLIAALILTIIIIIIMWPRQIWLLALISILLLLVVLYLAHLDPCR